MNLILKTIDELQGWFDAYVDGFYGTDARLNANVEYKQHHSARTRKEMHFLARQLGWEQPSIDLAEVIGLLHDVGRFEQLKRHRTYNDHQSLDHGVLGVEILEEMDVLTAFSDLEQAVIKAAIQHHNARFLPADLEPGTQRFAQLIRDADKLDIFRNSSNSYQQYLDDPQGFALEIGFPLDPYCSPEVIDATLKGQSIDYRKLKTVYDCLVMQLGWVYDLNFPVSMVTLQTRGYLDNLLAILPDWPEMRAVKQAVTHHVSLKIRQTSLS